jgi:hypothetical protein
MISLFSGGEMSNYQDQQNGTIYDGKYDDDTNAPRRLSVAKKLVLLFILIFGLVFAFVANRAMWFVALKSSFQTSGDYNFIQKLDFKVNEVEIKDMLLRKAKKTNRNITIVYLLPKFARMHIFYFSKKNDVFVQMGPFSFRTQAGINELELYGPDIIKFTWYGNYQFFYFGKALLAPVFHWFKDQLIKLQPKRIENDLKEPGIAVSYHWNQFKLIFTIYFFLPLILITILSKKLGKIMYLGFLYYAVMAMFYDLENLFYLGTFSWLKNFLGMKISYFFRISSIVMIMAALLIPLAYGVWEILRKKLNFENICYILFFILLPISLRF